MTVGTLPLFACLRINFQYGWKVFLLVCVCLISPIVVNAGTSLVLQLPPVYAACSGCSVEALHEHPLEFGPCDDGAQAVIWNEMEWQRCDDGEKYSWEEAKSYCRDLVLAGHCDWRLPSREELKSLVVCTNGITTPLKDYPEEPWHCGDDALAYEHPTIDSVFQSHSYYYWSSSSVDNPAQAYALHFGVGGTNNMPVRTAELYVRCVRSASSH